MNTQLRKVRSAALEACKGNVNLKYLARLKHGEIKEDGDGITGTVRGKEHACGGIYSEYTVATYTYKSGQLNVKIILGGVTVTTITVNL